MGLAEEFAHNGVVHLKGVVREDVVADWTAEFFARTGIDERDPRTFPKDHGRFAPKTRTIPIKEAAPRAWDAICELLGGEDAVDERTRVFGNNFNLNFNSGADKPWQGPSAQSPGWHKDGWFFRHFLDSPEQALLCLVVWRDIGPRSGGTFYAPDSVGPVARELLRHPEGLPHTHPFGDLIRECRDFRELIAEAGDVVILHPFTLHAPSQNPSGRIRIMNNRVLSLRHPMQFNRPDSRHTPLEQSILNALRVPRLDFRITGTRLRTEDFSMLAVDAA